MKPRTPLFALCLAVTLSGTAALAADNKTAARAAAIAGTDAYDRGDYAEAIQRFRQAEAHFHAPTHLLQIGRAHAQLGQLVLAREAYLSIVSEELPPNASRTFREVQEEASRELDELQPRIPSLTIQATEGESASLEIDGVVVGHNLTGVAYPLDPGKHAVRIFTDQASSETRHIELAEGQHETLSLSLTAASTPAPAGSATPAPEPTSETNDSNSSTRTLGYVVGGVGVAALIGGGVTGLIGLGQRGSLDERCPDQRCRYETNAERDALEADRDGLATLGTLTTILLIGGGALTATGVTLVLVGGPSDDAHALELKPTIGWNFAGVSATGSFQ